MLDGLVENQWHLQQLHRMALGKEPDPRRGTLRALALGLFRQLTGSRPRRIAAGGTGAAAVAPAAAPEPQRRSA